MKKLLSLLLFLPIFLLSCSTNIDEITISNEEIDEITNNQVNENVSVASKKVSDFDNYIEAINEYISRFKKLEKYELISSGNAEALLFTQKIYATVAKDKDKYKIYNTSTSSLKNQYHEAIFEDKIKYRDKKEDEFIEIELSDYKKTYGITPYDNTLFDYIINEDTAVLNLSASISSVTFFTVLWISFSNSLL